MDGTACVHHQPRALGPRLPGSSDARARRRYLRSAGAAGGKVVGNNGGKGASNAARTLAALRQRNLEPVLPPEVKQPAAVVLVVMPAEDTHHLLHAESLRSAEKELDNHRPSPRNRTGLTGNVLDLRNERTPPSDLRTKEPPEDSSAKGSASEVGPIAKMNVEGFQQAALTSVANRKHRQGGLVDGHNVLTVRHRAADYLIE